MQKQHFLQSNGTNDDRKISFKRDVIWFKNNSTNFALIISKGEVEVFECPEAVKEDILVGSIVCNFKVC